MAQLIHICPCCRDEFVSPAWEQHVYDVLRNRCFNLKPLEEVAAVATKDDDDDTA